MALNRANITWSAKQIAKMAGNGTFSFDNIIQRSYVWEQTRKSNLIHSLLEGFPVPPFYAKKVDGKVYDFLDGKQRINAIRGFIENEYYLIGIADEVTYTDAEGNVKTMDVNGYFFNDLPEELQDAIKDYHLTIYYYEDITPEQVRMLFAKLNNGKPLSTKERNIANCVDIVRVSEIGEHEFFQNTMTEKALATRKQLPIIMKMWMMLNEDIEDVSFESKVFNEVMQETKMSDDEREEIITVLDKMYAIYTALEEYRNAKVAKLVRRKMIAETHMVALVPFIKDAIEDEFSDEIMADFMVELFGNGVLVSERYAEACKGGSAKNVNVKIRNEEIDKAWDKFLNGAPEEDVDDDEEIVDETVNDDDDNIVTLETNEETANNDDAEPDDIEILSGETPEHVDEDMVASF